MPGLAIWPQQMVWKELRTTGCRTLPSWSQPHRIRAAAQDAVHDKMLNTGQVLKRDPAQPAQLLPAGASPPQAARSAPQDTGASGRQLGRQLSSSHGANAAPPERHGAQKHDVSGMSCHPHVYACLVSRTPPVSRTAQEPARPYLALSACTCMQQLPSPLPSTV